MEINIKKGNLTQQYRNMQIKEGQTTIDLGILNVQERLSLAKQLIQATNELLEGLSDPESFLK